MNEMGESTGVMGANANAIEIRDLSKSYPDFTLNHLNLTLPGGCIMGLIGENGAGKSTTIRLILDMIRRDSGTVRILGKDNQERLNATKEDIGVVLDEVGFPECLNAGQVNRIMKHTYKNWKEDVFFDYLRKLSVPEKKAFQEFSRGMKMKLGIAVALSHDAKLLILDVNCSILLAVYCVYHVRKMERNRTAYTAEREKCVSC